MARSRPSGGSSFLRLGLVGGFASEYAPHRGCWSTTASGAADGRTADAVPQPKRGGTGEWRTKHPEGKTRGSSDGSCGGCSIRTPSIRWQVMRDLAEDPDEPVAAERMTGMRARAVAGFASVRGGFYPRIYLLADASPLGTAIPSSTDLRKGERRWTTGKGEHGARTGRIAGHPQQGDDPGLPAHRAPAVRKGHYRYEAREIERSRGCRNCSHGMNRRTDRATTVETGAAARSE